MNLESKKQIAIILMAVFLGLIAAILATNYVQTSIVQESRRQHEEIKQEYMSKVQQDMDAVREELRRLEDQQQDVVQKAEQAAAAAAAQTASLTDLEAQRRRLAVGGDIESRSLAVYTPLGKRAYTVMIDSLSAVGGLINPGDYVDIIAHMSMPETDAKKDPNKDPNKVSTVVFQKVLILAVGVNLQAPEGGYAQQQQARSLTLTFALTPVEASLMSFLQQYGQMQLLLRPPDEKDIEVLAAASWAGLADYLFEKQGTELVIPRTRAALEPVKAPAQEEVKPFIEIFQGGKMQ